MRPPRHRLADTAMPQPAHNANIRQQAAGWVVRLDAGDMTVQERATLETWLDADPTHREALHRAQATWRELDLLAPAAPDTIRAPHARPRAKHARSRRAGHGRRRTHVVLAGTAAAILVLLGV